MGRELVQESSYLPTHCAMMLKVRQLYARHSVASILAGDSAEESSVSCEDSIEEAPEIIDVDNEVKGSPMQVGLVEKLVKEALGPDSEEAEQKVESPKREEIVDSPEAKPRELSELEK